MQGDMVIWMVFICLGMISVVEVYSASSTMSYGGKSHYWEPILQHGFYWVVGLLAAAVVSRVPCNKFKLGGVLGFMLAIALQVVALLSGKVNGAGRWIPMLGFSFQPSEFVKITLVTSIAFFYSVARDSKGVTMAGTKWACVLIVLAIGSIVTENLSTAILIFVTMLGMAFYAQVRTKILATVIVVMVTLAALALTLAYELPPSAIQACANSKNSVLHRVPTWVHRVTDTHELPADPRNYDITEHIQETHASIAVATSNFVGKGPGKSRQRDYLPQAYSDFIYAIIIEETGLVGGIAVIGLYLLFMWRCKNIAERCKLLFPSYLVMGLGLMIVLQAMVNMAVAVGAMPVTGQTLPLISRGGTSVIVNCISIGMILSVSRTARMTGEPAGSAPAAPVADEAVAPQQA